MWQGLSATKEMQIHKVFFATKCAFRDLEMFPEPRRSMDVVGASIVFRKQWPTRISGTCISLLLSVWRNRLPIAINARTRETNKHTSQVFHAKSWSKVNQGSKKQRPVLHCKSQISSLTLISSSQLAPTHWTPSERIETRGKVVAGQL